MEIIDKVITTIRYIMDGGNKKCRMKQDYTHPTATA